MGVGAERKTDYFKKVQGLFDKYPAALVISCDNVGSAHLQRIRKALRPLDGVMIFGKNSLVRKAIRSHLSVNPKLEVLLPSIVGNVGFIFCPSSGLAAVVKICKELRVAASAKAGMLAPQPVMVPAGPTGMEPTQTSFLQALNIPSKINKGQIEIVKDVELLKTGQRVGNSEAALLSKLNIRPFFYGLVIVSVYDAGAVFDAEVLDFTDDMIFGKMGNAITKLAAVSLATGLPTAASIPHSLLNGYKKVMSVALATDYTYPAVEKLKDRIKNPGKYASAAPAAAPAAAAPAPAAAKVDDKKAAKKEEKKEESDGGDMGFGLFD